MLFAALQMILGGVGHTWDTEGKCPGAAGGPLRAGTHGQGGFYVPMFLNCITGHEGVA